MAGKTYVTKGHSTYTGIPARGGYDHGPKNPVNQNAVQTKTIERVRAPAAAFADFVGSPSKTELLNEYVHSPTFSSSPNPNASYVRRTGLNYENTSPPKFYNEGSWPVKTRDFSSPVHGYHSEEAHLVQSGPGFVGAKQGRTGNISGPNRYSESGGPPMTHHPFTTSTNNINEALGFLESPNHSPRSGPRQKGILDELSTRAQPLEPQKRYARPAFVANPNDVYRKRY